MFLLMLTCFTSLGPLPVSDMEGLEYKNWGEMWVTDTIFGRRGLAVADNVYINKGSRRNIGAQTYNTYQYFTHPQYSKNILIQNVVLIYHVDKPVSWIITGTNLSLFAS